MTAKTIKHKYQSAVADAGNASEVGPLEWNDEHDLWLGFRSIGTTTDTIQHGDHLSLLVYSNVSAITASIAAPSGGNFPLGWAATIRNKGPSNLTIQGTSGATINNVASIVLAAEDALQLQSTGTANYEAVHISPATGYLPLSGGTMTGKITLDGDPSANLHAAPKQYVDTMIPKAGGTMTGLLTLSGDPSTGLQAATKQYVDTFLPKAGGTMTGFIVLHANPTGPMHAAPKQYVDLMLPLAGGTMTGDLIISKAAPMLDLRKAAAGQSNSIWGRTAGALRWVMMLGDTGAESGSNAGSQFVVQRYNDAGTVIDNPLVIARDTGQMTLFSPLNLPGNPSSALQAAPKQYVDALVPHCGRLEYVGATQLKFAPFNGNKIKVNGKVYTIPNAGLSGLANSNVRINNVTGQTLAANTTYWVFAEDTGSAIVGHFWTQAAGLNPPHHIPSTTAGNEGVETWYNGTFLEQFALIGMCRTNASGQFQDTAANRCVISWFNKRPRQLAGPTISNASTAGTFPVDMGGLTTFCAWLGDSLPVSAAGMIVVCNTALAQEYFNIGIDGTTNTIAGTCGIVPAAASTSNTIGCSGVVNIAGTPVVEGYHDLRGLGGGGAATHSYYFQIQGVVFG